MRIWKGALAGALALGGVMFMAEQASARPIAAPELVQLADVDTAAAPVASDCYWHRHSRGGYGWHRRYRWHPRYGYGWHRWHPRYGWHHRHHWRRYYY